MPDNFPRPPALPRAIAPDPRAEQPTLIPRLSEMEFKTDSPEPEWLARLRAEVRASVKREVESRGSESDLKQDAALAIAMADIAAVKADVAVLKSQSDTTGKEMTKVSDSLSGVLSPKVVGALVALGTLANLLLELLRGHKP